MDVKLQSRAIATTCLLALAVQDLPVPPLPWTLDSSAIAPLIPASPFLTPFSGLLHIHTCSVTLILLHLCQKYINWCMDFSAAFSQWQPRVILKWRNHLFPWCLGLMHSQFFFIVPSFCLFLNSKVPDRLFSSFVFMPLKRFIQPDMRKELLHLGLQR